ncbi:uncharacterized protein LOC116952258 [Petromyzon marinus]|uniref:uncharacterized protein LOC116952258 n=1 Tax=Petromyzon marinus TaxID=7757 RepID=UPI003F70EA5D
MWDTRLAAVTVAVTVVAVVAWGPLPASAAPQSSARRRPNPWGQQRSPSALSAAPRGRHGGDAGVISALVVPGPDEGGTGSSYDVLPGRTGHCAFSGMQMFDGSVWSPKPCVTCVCKRGAVACDEVDCPRPHCQRTARTAATCCPVCQNTEPQEGTAQTGEAAEAENQKKRTRGSKKGRKKPDDEVGGIKEQQEQQQEQEQREQEQREQQQREREKEQQQQQQQREREKEQQQREQQREQQQQQREQQQQQREKEQQQQQEQQREHQQREREKEQEEKAALAPAPPNPDGRFESPAPEIQRGASPDGTPPPLPPAAAAAAPPAKPDAAERARRWEQKRREEEEKRQRYLEEELRLQEQEEVSARAAAAPATPAPAGPTGATERAGVRGDVPDDAPSERPPPAPPAPPPAAAAPARPPPRPPARPRPRPPAAPALPRGFVPPGEDPPGDGATLAPAAPAAPELPRGCKSEDTTLTCDSAKLVYVPPLTDAHLLQLYLTGNAIAVIEAGTFRGLPRVEWIDLSRNQLTSHGIRDGTFENVTTLKRLFLDGNALTTIPSPLPPSLEELKINDNKLKVIDRSTFASLSSLLTLELEGNALSESTVDPLAFASLAGLHYLRLDRNKFRLIPSGLPPSLDELYLSDNQIEEISNGVFNKSSSLSILHLQNNRLQETRIHPRALISLKNLESIDFSHNRFVHVPSFLPTSLRHLVLTYNLLQRVPGYVFAHMSPGLEYLYLSFNRITSDGIDPVSFHGMQTSLLELYLDHNLLRTVPLGLADLAVLRTLLLNDNDIRTVPPQAFCVDSNPDDSALVTLRLDQNHIERRAVPRTAFSCVRSLSSVVLRPQKPPGRTPPSSSSSSSSRRGRPGRPRAKPEPDYDDYESHSGYEDEVRQEEEEYEEGDFGMDQDPAVWFFRLGLGLGLW